VYSQPAKPIDLAWFIVAGGTARKTIKAMFIVQNTYTAMLYWINMEMLSVAKASACRVQNSMISIAPQLRAVAQNWTEWAL
jgi:ubiquinone/menaquinone biosynthesis C-methylase UbiE